MQITSQSELALAGDLLQNFDALGVVKPVWKVLCGYVNRAVARIFCRRRK